MLTGIHHVAIAVDSVGTALDFYRDTLGLPLLDEDFNSEGVRGALLSAGEVLIELLEPVGDRDEAGLLAHGQGLHHLCFSSSDAPMDLQAASSAGLPLVDRAPRCCLTQMAGFLHPSALNGILVGLAAGPPMRPTDPATGLEARFNHIKVAVENLDERASTWSRGLGLREIDRREPPWLPVRAAIMAAGSGAAFVELVTWRSESSPVKSFVADHGEALYCLSLTVEDLPAAITALRRRGVRVADPPADGPGAAAFVSPRSTHGVLVQLASSGLARGHDSLAGTGGRR